MRFLLEPGEMMLWHNNTNLHSRTAFKMRAETYERIYRERLANASA